MASRCLKSIYKILLHSLTSWLGSFLPSDLSKKLQTAEIRNLTDYLGLTTTKLIERQNCGPNCEFSGYGTVLRQFRNWNVRKFVEVRQGDLKSVPEDVSNTITRAL